MKDLGNSLAPLKKNGSHGFLHRAQQRKDAPGTLHGTVHKSQCIAFHYPQKAAKTNQSFELIYRWPHGLSIATAARQVPCAHVKPLRPGPAGLALPVSGLACACAVGCTANAPVYGHRPLYCACSRSAGAGPVLWPPCAAPTQDPRACDLYPSGDFVLSIESPLATLRRCSASLGRTTPRE